MAAATVTRRIVVSQPAPSAAAAADIPGRFDVIIDGRGYRFPDHEDRKAVYAYSPTFVPRSNTQGDYGDNQQAFWMTQTQRDWSLGEQQKFFRAEEGRDRRYWHGTNVNVRTQGQVTIRPAVKTVEIGAAVRACCPRGAAVNSNIVVASATDLYEVGPDGTVTHRGGHGLGAGPSKFGIATDGTDVYLSTTAAGTVGVRKFASGYTTFSADGADALEFVNNTLFGLRSSDGALVKWDTAGTMSEVFGWQQADGGDRGGTTGCVRAYGGKLLILWSDGPHGPELWLHEGTAPAMIATLPPNFYAHDLRVVSGIVFVGGSFTRIANGVPTDYQTQPAVYFYANGQVGLLWRADDYDTRVVTDLTTAGHPALGALDDGLVFTDDTRGQFMFYDVVVGGVHSVGGYATGGLTPLIAASQRSFVHTRTGSSIFMYPDTTTVAESASVTGSLVDFDSSLEKRVQSVKIDAVIPSGATVDIAYRLEDVDGAYTVLVNGAASGTEYPVTQTGHAISVRYTLNRGASTTGPTLKRTYVRAAPMQDTFKRRQYLLDLSGRDSDQMVQLRDTSLHVKDGMQMAADLIAAVTSREPVTITDRFGTYEAIIDPENFQIVEVRPEEFLAVVPVRGV